MPNSIKHRAIVYRTRGHGAGPITRLMSPSDLGEIIKPFVFLDIFQVRNEARRGMGGGMPLHPHSGIATVTVLTQGSAHFDDPTHGQGVIGYGGVEWMRAGGGVWHGKEMSMDHDPFVQGFQLWLSLPPELENAAPESRYIESKDMLQAGPAYVVVGQYDGQQSPVPAPDGINYLLVRLQPEQRWTYQPPKGHQIAWLAVAQGQLLAEHSISAGEMVVFEEGEEEITLQAHGSQDTVFVLGSAVPHPHELHLGNYSVHTSKEALRKGEDRIRELAEIIRNAGDRTTASGTVPVLK